MPKQVKAKKPLLRSKTLPLLKLIQTALAFLSLGGFHSSAMANENDHIILLVGLGNPGSQYEKQRHNVGFMAVDHMADLLKAGASKSKFEGEWRDARLDDGTRVIFLKPMTYMNESGRSVGQMARFFKIKPDQIIVLHDELDLQAGQVKIKTGGGHAGHNGLRSIDAHLGTQNYKRVRIGIGHPGDKARVTGHVLGDFSSADQEWLDPMLKSMAKHAKLLIAGKDSLFLTKLNEGKNKK